MKNKYYFTLVIFVFLLTGCKQDELLTGLQQSQANEVISILQRNNINAKKIDLAKSEFAITVDPTDFVASVDLINLYGLPRPAAIEVSEMFPVDSLVSSPRAEKARLYSAIEQRLAQSLLSIQGVITAKVHVSYDIDGNEGSRRKAQVHISSLLTYEDDNINSTLLINDIKRFLKNSFDDVDYDNISVLLSKINSTQRTPATYIKETEIDFIGFLTALLIILMLIFIISYLSFKNKDSFLMKKIKGKTSLFDKEANIMKSSEETIENK